jgi:hypothetical protein
LAEPCLHTLAAKRKEDLNVKINFLRSISLAAFGASLLAIGSASAIAQDVYKVNYFSNNVAPAVIIAPAVAIIVPDATVRIDNPGLTYGNICAMVYVFDADQQLTECCGCVETHNGLRTLSVRNDLTRNPLTGVRSTNGVIKILSTTPVGGVCNPAATANAVPSIRAWATHVQNPVGGASPLTETEFSDSTLGAVELANLQAQCQFAQILGSGQGICSCGTGD